MSACVVPVSLYLEKLAFFPTEDDPTLKYTKEGKDHPMNEFFMDLGSAAGAVKPASEGGSDEKVERSILANVKLYR